MKITLFMCAGAIIVVSGKKNISEMAGISNSKLSNGLTCEQNQNLFVKHRE